MQAGFSGGFCTDVLRDLVDIVHEPHRVPEGIGVDILDQEGLLCAIRQTEVYLIGIVDVAHLDGFITEIGILNAEKPTDLLQFLIQIQNKTSFRVLACRKGKRTMAAAARQHILDYSIASWGKCQSKSR